MTVLLVVIGIFVVVGLVVGEREAENKKRYWLKSIFILGLVITLLFLFGPLFIISPIKIGYAKITAGEATVFYPAKEEAIRVFPKPGSQETKMTTRREQTQKIIEAALGAVKANEEFYKIPVEVKVVVAATDIDMLRYGGIIAGGGTGNEFGIIIYEPKASQDLIAHELSHKTLRLVLGPIDSLRVPTWFDEGLATYVGKQDFYLSLGGLKEEMVKGEHFEDLSRWEGFRGKLTWKFVEVEKQRRAYGQMYLFMKYLADNYGEDKLFKVVMRIKEKSFAQAFEDVFGATSQELFQEFLKEVKNS